ncbi:MAG: phosphoglycerate kinase [Candidatus Aenigmarchaeota archaeon]|nr:phosphoglycerate kinase [Candidatus Aenigmarchaeota archaeon]
MDLNGKNVFAKVDINSSFDEKTGAFRDVEKILQAVRTIKFAFDNDARSVIVASHQGDQGKNETLKNHVPIMQLHLPHLKVKFAGVRAGDDVLNMLDENAVIVLENTRADEEEWNSNDIKQTKMYKMIKQIPNLVFLKDDPASHRKELTTYHIPKTLHEEGFQVFTGPVLQEDIDLAEKVSKILEETDSFAILGGKKLPDQLEILPQMLKKFPRMRAMLGGLFSVYMERAQGKNVGDNEKLWKDEDKLLESAKTMITEFNGRIMLPTDYCINNGSGFVCAPVKELHTGKVIDIGPDTILKYMETLGSAKNASVLVNGATGFYEAAPSVNEPGMRGAAHVYSEAFDEKHGHIVMGFGGDSMALFNRLGFKPHINSSSGKAFFKRVIYGPYYGLEWLKKQEIKV